MQKILQKEREQPFFFYYRAIVLELFVIYLILYNFYSLNFILQFIFLFIYF